MAKRRRLSKRIATMPVVDPAEFDAAMDLIEGYVSGLEKVAVNDAAKAKLLERPRVRRVQRLGGDIEGVLE